MADSAPHLSLKTAADQLTDALDALDAALDPVLARLSRAEDRVSETEGFAEDRSRLASELDAATARARDLETQLASREAEFQRLSKDTRAEIDATIGVLRDALRGAA